MDDSEKWFCVPFFEPLFGAVFSVIFHVTAKSAKIADKLSVVFGHFIFSLYLDKKRNQQNNDNYIVETFQEIVY